MEQKSFKDLKKGDVIFLYFTTSKDLWILQKEKHVYAHRKCIIESSYQCYKFNGNHIYTSAYARYSIDVPVGDLERSKIELFGSRIISTNIIDMLPLMARSNLVRLYGVSQVSLTKQLVTLLIKVPRFLVEKVKYDHRIINTSADE